MPDIRDIAMAVAALESACVWLDTAESGLQYTAMINSYVAAGRTPLEALATAARAADLNPVDYRVAGALMRLWEAAERTLRLEVIAQHYPKANDGVTEQVAHDLRHALAGLKGAQTDGAERGPEPAERSGVPGR